MLQIRPALGAHAAWRAVTPSGSSKAVVVEDRSAQYDRAQSPSSASAFGVVCPRRSFVYAAETTRGCSRMSPEYAAMVSVYLAAASIANRVVRPASVAAATLV